jgi:hypothetical protein
MYRAVAGFTICTAIVVAGRAHSTHLDKLDDHVWRNPMKHVPRFEVVCSQCAGVGVRSDFAEGAPPSTIIKCSVCDAPRGTLGALQELANSNRHDLLEA